MKNWPNAPLSNVMSINIDAVQSLELDSVNLAGVYGFGRGLFKRGLMSPLDTTYKAFHKLHAGDFVISMPKAWEGAIARVPEEFEGWFLSPVFPTFKADSSKIDTKYLDWYCKRESVWNELSFKAKGIGARRESVSAAQFLSLKIPLPTLDEQQTIVTRLDAVAEKIRQVETKLDEIEADAEHLLSIQFQETIKGADWLPIAKVAPLVRRNVEIDIEQSYSEVGARSFGKGLFFKPNFDGAEATWQKPVWISEGNLVFSNIKAWEGAIAVAQKEHDGCIASHRYLTCIPVSEKVTANFICYHLLSSEGLEKIGKASLGTADRNRTLGLGKLMAIQVPVPELCKQQAFDVLQCKIADMKTKHQAIRLELKALLPSMLEQIFTPSADNHD